MSHQKTVLLLLRLGLAFVFMYPAISALFYPDNWIGYFPGFLLKIFPQMFLLISFSALEIILALSLLTGWKVKWASLTAAIILAAIVIFDFGIIDVVFRDAGLAAMALTLWFLS